jgi:hypothetical protein
VSIREKEQHAKTAGVQLYAIIGYKEVNARTVEVVVYVHIIK